MALRETENHLSYIVHGLRGVIPMVSWIDFELQGPLVSDGFRMYFESCIWNKWNHSLKDLISQLPDILEANRKVLMTQDICFSLRRAELPQVSPFYT